VSKEQTLLFCVGATKAGTSWLHRYLSDHPECHLRSVKELHYFDALDAGKLDQQVRQTQRSIDALVSKLDDANEVRTANILRQINDRNQWLGVLEHGSQNDAAYLAYLRDGQVGEHVIAELTPAYSLLDHSRLAAMAALTPLTKFIYLLRDPIDRLWSHVRMMSSRRSDDGQVLRDRTDRIFARTLAGKEAAIEDRSDYRAALRKLTAAIAPENLLIEFYENMFTGDAIARICRFLNIEYIPANTNQRIHAGQPLAILDEQRLKAREWLAEQYDYVRDTLGATPAGWQYNLAKVQA